MDSEKNELSKVSKIFDDFLLFLLDESFYNKQFQLCKSGFQTLIAVYVRICTISRVWKSKLYKVKKLKIYWKIRIQRKISTGDSSFSINCLCMWWMIPPGTFYLCNKITGTIILDISSKLSLDMNFVPVSIVNWEDPIDV